ncbi:MAG TPA: CYTH and CHAD domain-containing protein [Acidimicrobiia bacterium]
MGVGSQEERELKFTPAPELDLVAALGTLADAGGTSGTGGDGLHADEPRTKHFHAVYYDTADLRLARAGASLRHREDGWTVKLAGASGMALVRSELHVDGPAGDPPADAVDLVHALIRHAPLQVAAHLDTVRTSVALHDSDGALVAEAVDDAVTVHDGVCPDTAFRELEVEFADGVSKHVVSRIADRLREAGAGSPEHLPKIVRALGARALDAPDLVPPPKLDFASTATKVLRAAIIRSTARLLAHDPGVRLGTDPEDVHQARVATRRLRSDLRTFRPVVDPAWDEPLRDELKWLADLLGAVRDTDVLLGRLDAHVAALPASDRAGGAHLLDGLHAQRDAAREELLAAMRSPRYFDLLERLLAASRLVPAADDAVDLALDLGDLVAKPWKKLRTAMEELGDEPPDAELHAARIRAKRARYAAEAVAPAVGQGAKQFASAVAGLQEVLGEHQDAVVAGEWLRAHVPTGEHAARAAFVAGQLAAWEDAAAQASREEWPAAWKRARHQSLRRWM